MRAMLPSHQLCAQLSSVGIHVDMRGPFQGRRQFVWHQQPCPVQKGVLSISVPYLVAAAPSCRFLAACCFLPKVAGLSSSSCLVLLSGGFLPAAASAWLPAGSWGTSVPTCPTQTVVSQRRRGLRPA